MKALSNRVRNICLHLDERAMLELMQRYNPPFKINDATPLITMHKLRHAAYRQFTLAERQLSAEWLMNHGYNDFEGKPILSIPQV